MISIVHPLSDELLGLVENDGDCAGDTGKDTSWRWMAIAVLVIGLLAWATR